MTAAADRIRVHVDRAYVHLIVLTEPKLIAGSSTCSMTLWIPDPKPFK